MATRKPPSLKASSTSPLDFIVALDDKYCRYFRQGFPTSGNQLRCYKVHTSKRFPARSEKLPKSLVILELRERALPFSACTPRRAAHSRLRNPEIIGTRSS